MHKEQLTLLLRQGADIDPRPTRQCPDENEIAGFVDDALGAEEAQEIRRHVAGCDFCLARVGFLARLEQAEPAEVPSALLARVRGLPEARRSTLATRWRWATASATAAVVLAVLWVGRSGPVKSPVAAPSTVRESAGLAQNPEILWPPEGAAIALDQLEVRWTAVPDALFYEIQLVTVDGDRMWDAKVETERQRVPGDVRLVPGQELFVWVRAHMPDGRTLQSAIVGFRLSAGGTVPE